ncbi:MAG: prolipoprotein diacylglyceryl transferase [Methylotenera sp. 24-45-7]|jgi:phosphatidylglycerol:prolipoprotein diacylglycerol transferase|nr:MAG: prolipoprotein diacylglyceryl transferase [Mehylophilales bacterium 35-46-6]OYZ40262.1 MAG: prolipoprotein diacylglyceryl transferase [Methylotenera sp. 24-45-7]OZA10006.1 MAG: prolipoprotein diacylglyceryl transferase [Methylotenera sp. 17-45-7]OZA54138.1 MAG: prolipoprotein diacylglyceryl transferase [Methylophilales bacterium 39-45-7]HQS37284.1 prolipoprotein diacylglyceryl transferase [Methylotenera sp.]
MFVHPQFDPIAIHLGSFGIHWYGLMYLTGFISFLVLGKWQINHRTWYRWNVSMLDDALFFGALGVIIGGRLGYVLFYQLDYFVAHPSEILAVWQGGMSFHGGFLGVLAAMWVFGRKYRLNWLKIMDFVAPLVPIGLGAGRMGNFINAELWGRVTNSSFGMAFPNVDDALRHPSQLYEFALEGVALFLILWIYASKPRATGTISAMFLIFYGSFRFLVEFTREPDDYLGLLSMGLSMGQWLSLPMVIVGLIMLTICQKKKLR